MGSIHRLSAPPAPTGDASGSSARADELLIYTNGSGPRTATADKTAGWGVVILEAGMDAKEYWGPVHCHLGARHLLGAIEETNITADLSFVITAMKYLLEVDCGSQPACVRSDSKYAMDMAQGLKNTHTHFRLVQGAQRLYNLVRSMRLIRFEGVEGHSSDVWSRQAGALSQNGASNAKRVWEGFGDTK